MRKKSIATPKPAIILATVESTPLSTTSITSLSECMKQPSSIYFLFPEASF
jgi:hypothetical protein